MQRSTTGRKYGPEPLPERSSLKVYLPVELRKAVADIAKRDGLPETRVITRMVAECLGEPVPPYCLPAKADDNQEELPLSRAS